MFCTQAQMTFDKNLVVCIDYQAGIKVLLFIRSDRAKVFIA